MSRGREALTRVLLTAIVAGCGSVAGASIFPDRTEPSEITLPRARPQGQYALERAFPDLEFEGSPISIRRSPIPDALFVLTQEGSIYIVNNMENPESELFMDLTQQVAFVWASGLYDIAFHPNYLENGLFYLVYGKIGGGFYQQLVKYCSVPGDLRRGDADSGEILISQPDVHATHNGGSIAFGGDGYLYWSLGDGGGDLNKWIHNVQQIDRGFFSAVLRIDVDGRPGSLDPNPAPDSGIAGQLVTVGNYRIPSDNPFVTAVEFNGEAVDPGKVRTEFYAVGFRNPWRMSFDALTGTLWLGDVGDNRREEINKIVSGGNYGWPFKEGSLAGRYVSAFSVPEGFVSVEPVYELIHQGASGVIGGFVYRGDSMPELYGKYIFGDVSTTKIQALSRDAAGDVIDLVDGANVTTLEMDPRTGDILATDVWQKSVWRVSRDGTQASEEWPSVLSGTGLFSDLENLSPAKGVVPYEVNVPFWSDHALKRRWFRLPDIESRIKQADEMSLISPEGTVWVKHFDMPTDHADPDQVKRIETRVLVKSNDGVFGASYKWNDEGTDAELVSEQGQAADITVQTDSGQVKREWLYPSRTQCLVCHTEVGGGALSFNVAQMNRPVGESVDAANQLLLLEQHGYLDRDAAVEVDDQRQYDGASEEDVGLTRRARSFLAVNCSQCHQPGGPSPGNWDARIIVPLDRAGILDGAVASGGDDLRRVVSPSSLEHSELYRRLSNLGPKHMPPLATSELNEEGINLIENWILQMQAHEIDYSEFLKYYALSGEEAARDVDIDGDGLGNYGEFLLKRSPLDAEQDTLVEIRRSGDELDLHVDILSERLTRIERSSTLAGGVWERVAEYRFPAQSSKKKVVVVNEGGAVFFRVSVSEH